MHTPSKFCTRERSPSTTFTATRTVSPGMKAGTARRAVRRAISSASYCWMMFMAMVLLARFLRGSRCAGNRRPAHVRCEAPPQVGAAGAGDLFGLRPPPGGDRAMGAGQPDLGHRHAVPFGRAGVMRAFQPARRQPFLLPTFAP